MQALRVAADVKHWLSALQDIIKPAVSLDRNRAILLNIDPNKKLLTMIDEDTDSSYKVSIPIRIGGRGSSVCCRVPAGKLEPMDDLFRFAQGELHLTCRPATLFFQSGKKRFHVPNYLVEAPANRKEAFVPFSNHFPAPAQIVRFPVSDVGTLLRAAESSQDPAVTVRVEEGCVWIGTEEFPADCRQPGVYRWPRRALCQRLSQLPESVPVYVQADDHSVFIFANSRFAAANPPGARAEAAVVREILVKPFPAMTLYISRRDAGKRPGEADRWMWTNTGLTNEKERRRERAAAPFQQEKPADRLQKGDPNGRTAGTDWPSSDSGQRSEIQLFRPTIDENGSDLPEAADESAAFDGSGNLVQPPEVVQSTGSATLDSANPPESAKIQESPEPEESGLEALERLPGLHFVKKQIRDIARFAVFEQKRAEILGIPANPPTLHMAFLGNPGTGKTMVARMLGRIFKELGLLEKGHVVEVDRQVLVGAYMGHTEANLKKYVRNALGGILFVDEAYALYKKDSHKDFGMTAINGLVKVMEDYRHNLAVILAGYKSEMRELLSANPGLGERIPFHVEFPDYTEEELGEIAEYIALRERYVLSGDAREALIKQALRRKTDETFGNARTVRNLIEQAKIRHAVRSAESAPAAGTYTTLTADDFLEEGIPAGESLENVLAELDRLVGLQQIKQLVRQIVDVLRLEKQRANLGLTNNPVTLHMAFTGNPGTGKTTVARLLGKILRALDLLPKGHFVEVSRKDLVAGFIGQTALKTAEKIKEAMGGVLFVDEAYALAGRSREDFGLEALTTLIKEMEDKKGLFTVILAGYTQQMEDLFKANPGLRSRMRFTLHFPDYTAGELVEIVKRKAEESCYRLSEAAEEKLWMYFIRECSSAETDFGNGRLAEKIFEHAKLKMSARLAQTLESVDRETLITITEEDIEMDC